MRVSVTVGSVVPMSTMGISNFSDVRSRIWQFWPSMHPAMPQQFSSKSILTSSADEAPHRADSLWSLSA